VRDRWKRYTGLKSLADNREAQAAKALADSMQQLQAKQAELDAACEAAREVKLAAVRLQLTEECAEKKWPRQDRASCERYYSDYGITTPHQVGLFYDLPECVKAHDYRTSYRRSDR